MIPELVITISGIRTSVATVQMDFKIAYVGTAVLAFAFLTLGATVMYGSGEVFSAAGTVFSTQLIDLYIQTLGAWTEPIIVVTAVTVMFSTTLAIIDGYPRVIDRIVQVIREKDPAVTADRGVSPVYWMAMGVVGSLTVLVLYFFVGNLTEMVDFVTIVAFLTGPVLGWLNLKSSPPLQCHPSIVRAPQWCVTPTSASSVWARWPRFF